MYTYFVSNGSAVKIGRTKLSAVERIASLQTSSSTKLRLLLVINHDCEKKCHQYFAKYRTSGEWFTLPKAMHEFLHRERPLDPSAGYGVICQLQSLHGPLTDIQRSEDEDHWLLCPICGGDYQHAGTVSEHIPGNDDHSACTALQAINGFRGDAIRIPMHGECGHHWTFVLGFHKGNTLLTVGRATEQDLEERS